MSFRSATRFVAILPSVLAAGLCLAPVHAANTVYATDPVTLPASDAQDFHNARDLLDSWHGDSLPLRKAGPLIASVISRHPNFLPAYVEEARLTIMERRTGEGEAERLRRAEEILLATSRKDARYAKPHVLLGHVYIYMGKRDLARKELTIAENIGTDDPWLDLNWADLLLREGKVEEVYTRCMAVLQSETENTKAIASAFEAMSLVASSVDKAGGGRTVEELLASLKLDDARIESLAMRLLRSHDSGRQIAMEMIKYLLATAPNRPGAYLLLGDRARHAARVSRNELRVVYDSEEADRAVAAYEHALAVDPENAKAFARLAGMYIDMQAPPIQAAKMLDAARAKKLQTPELEFEEARQMFYSGKRKPAIAVLERLATTRGEDDFIWSVRAALRAAYIMEANLDGAEKLFQQALRSDNDRAYAYYEYGQFLLQYRGRIDESLLRSRAALEYRDLPKARQSMAAALYAKATLAQDAGDEKQVQALMSEAWGIYPDRQGMIALSGPYGEKVAEMFKRIEQPMVVIVPSRENHRDGT
jgi:tetratricopeptide (TPR) repeat protein